MSILEVAAVVVGTVLVLATVLSAARTVVLPHGRPMRITRVVFRGYRVVFDAAARVIRDDDRRHHWFSFYGPVSLLTLPLVWLGLALAGFTLVFWGMDTKPLADAFKLAGSSLLTIGFYDVDDVPRLAVGFLAAGLSISVLGLLLVTYLPTMYGAYSDRETAITALESYAGEPPSAQEMLARLHLIGAWDELPEIWAEWRLQFATLRETHTALPGVVVFQSSTPGRSWVRAVGALLDAAAVHEAISTEGDAEAQLALRAGFLALREIAEQFEIPFDPDPAPDDPISVTRDEFERVCNHLDDVGVPRSRTGDEAWAAYAGWRVNYDAALIGLAELTGQSGVPLAR